MRFVWQSGLILVTPILIWNILLHHDLPPSYQHGGRWNDYPLALSLSEHITRVLTFVLCAFLIIDYSKPVNYRAWTIYIVGTLLYFGSWLAVILWPLSNWSQSLIGFTSPAWTATLWLLGIGFLSSKTSSRRALVKYSYFLMAALFMLFHTYHAVFAFTK
jgi:hypothetical protein